MMAEFARVAQLSEIPPGGRKQVFVDDVAVLLIRCGDEVHAIEDVCTHDGQPLTDGPLSADCQITCPRHGARFDVRTGAALCMPATEPVETYRVEIRDGGVYLQGKD